MDYLKQYINKKTLNRNIITIVTVQAKMVTIQLSAWLYERT